MVDDIDEALNFSDLSAVIPQLIGVNDLWNVKFIQEPGEEQFGGLSIAMPLKQYVEHEAVLVHRPPQPVSDAIPRRVDLIQRSQREPSRGSR